MLRGEQNKSPHSPKSTDEESRAFNGCDCRLVPIFDEGKEKNIYKTKICYSDTLNVAMKCVEFEL